MDPSCFITSTSEFVFHASLIEAGQLEKDCEFLVLVGDRDGSIADALNVRNRPFCTMTSLARDASSPLSLLSGMIPLPDLF